MPQLTHESHGLTCALCGATTPPELNDLGLEEFLLTTVEAGWWWDLRTNEIWCPDCHKREEEDADVPVYGVVNCANCECVIPDGQASYEGMRGLICATCYENGAGVDDEQEESDGRDRT